MSNPGPSVTQSTNLSPLTGTFDANGKLITAYGPGGVAQTQIATYATDPLTGGLGLVPLAANGSIEGGILAPTTLPTAVAGSAGLPNGQYVWNVTFTTADGETNANELLMSKVTLTNQQANLTAIPVSTDSSVTGRNIYRSKDATTDPTGNIQRQLFLVGTISDNTTTTFTDNVADASLVTVMPSINRLAPYFHQNNLRVGSLSGGTVTLGGLAMNNWTGYACTAIGYAALKESTFSARNVAVGTYSLTSNTSGSWNTAVGTHSLNSNVGSTGNTAVGYGALFTGATTSGEPNTAIGSQSLYNWNSANGGNTAVGKATGYNITTGYNNTLMGGYAGQSIGSGSNNVCIGFSAGINNAGSNNTFVGSGLGPTWTSGDGNTAIGRSALNSQVSGVGNIAIGLNAGKYETASNTFYINNQDRTNTAGDKSLSLMYGVMAATAASQSLAINAVLAPLVTTVAGLPAAAAGNKGFKAMVTDAISATPAFCSTTVGQGSGSAVVPVFSDGTIWRFG